MSEEWGNKKKGGMMGMVGGGKGEGQVVTKEGVNAKKDARSIYKQLL